MKKKSYPYGSLWTTKGANTLMTRVGRMSANSTAWGEKIQGCQSDQTPERAGGLLLNH